MQLIKKYITRVSITVYFATYAVSRFFKIPDIKIIIGILAVIVTLALIFE